MTKFAGFLFLMTCSVFATALAQINTSIQTRFARSVDLLAVDGTQIKVSYERDDRFLTIGIIDSSEYSISVKTQSGEPYETVTAQISSICAGEHSYSAVVDQIDANAYQTYFANYFLRFQNRDSRCGSELRVFRNGRALRDSLTGKDYFLVLDENAYNRVKPRQLDYTICGSSGIAFLLVKKGERSELYSILTERDQFGSVIRSQQSRLFGFAGSFRAQSGINDSKKKITVWDGLGMMEISGGLGAESAAVTFNRETFLPSGQKLLAGSKMQVGGCSSGMMSDLN